MTAQQKLHLDLHARLRGVVTASGWPLCGIARRYPPRTTFDRAEVDCARCMGSPHFDDRSRARHEHSRKIGADRQRARNAAVAMLIKLHAEEFAQLYEAELVIKALAEGSVPITVAEAACLQAFRADYPWQGSRSAQFGQVGNAVPPPVAAAIIGALLGLDWQTAVSSYQQQTLTEAFA